MAVTEQAVEIDEQKLGAFMGQAVGELGATLGAALVVIGDQLGLYKAMAGAGPLTSDGARRAHRHRRALRARVAERPGGGRLRHLRPGDEDLHAAARAGARARRRGEPVLPLRRVPGLHVARPRRAEDPRGVHERRRRRLARAPPRSVRGHRALLPPGLQRAPRRRVDPGARRRRGEAARAARVADVGCGHGASTIIMAKAFPDSKFVGFDYHEASIEARARRAQRTRASPTACASRSRRRAGSRARYDFVTMFDCLHDMGDPVGAARHVHGALDDDGTWLIVEPFAGDKVEDNLNPVGRVYYGASTLVCTPASLSQEVGLGARRAGRRGAPARGRHRRRVHALPPRDRDAVQPRARGASVSTTIAAIDVAAIRHPRARARPRRVRRARRRTGRYESFGDGRAHILFLPSWTLVHAAPVEGAGAVPRPALPRRHVRPARQRRLGPARRSRPPTREPEIAADAVAVLDALGIERAALVALSRGALPALMLAAEHPERVTAAAFIGPSRPPSRPAPRSQPTSMPSCPSTRAGSATTATAWRRDFAGFCEWFFGEMFPEPHSTRQIETGSNGRAGRPPRCSGQDGRRSEASTRRRRGSWRARALPRAGDPRRRGPHLPAPPKAPSSQRRPAAGSSRSRAAATRPTRATRCASTCCCASSCCRRAPPPTWLRARGAPAARALRLLADRPRARPPRPRDRARAAPPAARASRSTGSRSRRRRRCSRPRASASTRPAPSSPASARTSSRRRASTACPCSRRCGAWTRSWSRTSCSSTTSRGTGCYDLWIGDEAWDVDYFLHENPELKSAPYAWLTDFVGYLPLPEGGEREAFLTADYNAEMVEQVARYPHVRDRAIFVGDPDDIVAGRFGPGPAGDPAVGRGALRVQRAHHRLRPAHAPPSARRCGASSAGARTSRSAWSPSAARASARTCCERVLAAEPAARRLVPGCAWWPCAARASIPRRSTPAASRCTATSTASTAGSTPATSASCRAG